MPANEKLATAGTDGAINAGAARAFLSYWRAPDIRIMGVGIGAKAGLPGRGAAGPVLLHVG
jgi:hypothetical protein